MRRLPRPFLFAAASLLASCAHAPPPQATKVDADWIRPRLDEAARAAVACVRSEPDRAVELELNRAGRPRAFVHPYPASDEEQSCADHAAAALPNQPSNDVVRTMVRGDGELLDPTAERARSLTLRSRAVDQLAAINQCRSGLVARRPGGGGRVGLAITVDDDGKVQSAEVPASTLDATADACVLAAVRALDLPPIPGSYHYSYIFTGNGIEVGASDVDPIDPFTLSHGIDAVRGPLHACLGIYRTQNRLLLKVRFGNDGAPITTSIERETGSTVQVDDDVRADACVRRVAMTIRVLPFDGPPVDRTVPFTLK